MAKSGAPTRAERREQQMANAFETMSKAMELQAQTNSELVAKIGTEPTREQARTIDPVAEFAQVAKPAPKGKAGVIYKSGSRGLRQVLKSSRKIHTGDDYQIVPPVVADFENATYRTNDPEIIDMIDAKIAFRKNRGQQPRIVKFKDEVAEALADQSKDVKPVVSSEVTHETSVDELIS